MASSVVPLSLLGQENQNQVQYDFQSDDAAGTGISVHDANGIIYGTILSVKLRWSKQGATWLPGHVTPLALASCNANDILMVPLHF